MPKTKTKVSYCQFAYPVLVEDEDAQDMPTFSSLECPMCGCGQFRPCRPVLERKRGMEMAVECAAGHTFRVLVRFAPGRFPARLLFQTKTFCGEANVLDSRTGKPVR